MTTINRQILPFVQLIAKREGIFYRYLALHIELPSVKLFADNAQHFHSAFHFELMPFHRMRMCIVLVLAALRPIHGHVALN